MLTRIELRVSESSYYIVAICLSLMILKKLEMRLACVRKTIVSSRLSMFGGMKYQVLQRGYVRSLVVMIM